MMQHNLKTDSCAIGGDYCLREVENNITIFQTFVMPGNRLNGIEIILTDFDETGAVKIELCKQDGTVIDTASLHLEECANGQFQEIRFKKRPFLHKGNTYLIEISVDSDSILVPKTIMIPQENGNSITGITKIGSDVIENHVMAINYNYQDGPVGLPVLGIQIQISAFIFIIAFYIWKGSYGKRQSNELLLYLLASGFLVWIISVYLTKGQTLYTIIHQDDTDQFMDFFNSIQYGREPYEKGVIYPPLANLLYAILGHLIPANRLVPTTDVRNTQMGGIVYYLFTFVITYFLIQLIHVSGYRFQKRIQNIIFDICILMSIPFIFCYERGNIILLCLVCCMSYYYFNDIGKEKESYIGLALAIAIKIYPAIYGLMELKKKKKIGMLILISIIAFVFPFVFFPSGSLKRMIINIAMTTAEFQNNGVGFRHDLENLMHIIQIATGFTIPQAVTVGIRGGCAIAGCIAILLDSNMDKWKQLCICSIILILFPGFSYTYTLIFMLIPLLAFMKNESFTGRDYVYVFLFALIFMSYIVPDRSDILGLVNVKYALTYATLFQTLALVILYIVIIIESVQNVIKKKQY